MSFGQFLSIMRARWRIAAMVLLITVGSALTISLLLPKTYVATASVVVDIKPDPIGGMVMGMMMPAFMATQVDVIRSDRVALRVVRNLKLTENSEIRTQWLAATEGQGRSRQADEEKESHGRDQDHDEITRHPAGRGFLERFDAHP